MPGGMKTRDLNYVTIRSELGWAILRKWLICCHFPGLRKNCVCLRVFAHASPRWDSPLHTFHPKFLGPLRMRDFYSTRICPSISEWIPERMPVSDRAPWTPPTKTVVCPAGRSGSGVERAQPRGDGPPRCVRGRMPLGPGVVLTVYSCPGDRAQLWPHGGRRFQMEKLASALGTLRKKFAKNPGLLSYWEDLKARVLHLDYMDGL